MGRSPVKLNLGCGNKKWEGFVNVDLPGNYSGEKPDVESDLRKLPFKNNYADEVHSIHSVEHFYRWELEPLLKEWRRVLRNNGSLIIETPCMDKVIQYIVRSYGSGVFAGNMVCWPLWGDPKYKDPAMVHKWCYTMGELKQALLSVGFGEVYFEEPKYHVKDRDMRVIAIK